MRRRCAASAWFLWRAYLRYLLRQATCLVGCHVWFPDVGSCIKAMVLHNSSRFAFSLLYTASLLQVKVGLIKRTKKLKAPVPELLVSQCPALTDKLGTNATWATAQTAITNYEKNGFVNEPNMLATAKSQARGAPFISSEHVVEHV